MRPSLTLLLSAGLLASAADIYVSPCGSDSNAGDSAGKPFRTLTKAQEAVRKLATSSMAEDVRVHLARGRYRVTGPLNFTSADSGKNGHTVSWIGSNATVSGGVKVSNWTLASTGIYSASVPAGLKSRNLYVGGKAANYARRKITRKDFVYTNTSMVWNSTTYDYFMSIPGLENGEVRFINSFTDRYAPIQAVGNRELIMKQDCWMNQVWGWDKVNKPYGDAGVWIQNALGLMSDGGQYYLDSGAGKVYYRPLDGEDMSHIEAILAVQEVLLSIGGTYDDPAHDISFKGISFAHSTWLRPNDYGYADQQTGGYIGENVTWPAYPEFEASRPRWYQLPSAIQISAASKIKMTNCTYQQLGAGGIGIGNDPNAHITNVGLGASNISVVDGYFTQVMGNSITAGGIQANNSHHPSDPRMINSGIIVSGNIFYNNSALFTSTVPILLTYVQYSTVSHNDVYYATYSAICHGYGWGSNDAGGSGYYEGDGLYKYQPEYQTPTTSKNNLIDGNLLHHYSWVLQDSGGIYSLSRSPGTLVTNNYIYDSAYRGLYLDEGTSNMTYINNVCLSGNLWYGPNEQYAYHTGNNTLIDNWGKVGPVLDGFPDHTGVYNNTFLRNFIVSDVTQTSEKAQRAAYRAGVLPGRRADRPVSNNASLADSYLSLGGAGGVLFVNISNFDDVAFTNVAFSVSAPGQTLEPADVPTSVPADSYAVAKYRADGTSQGNITATATYTNPRTGRKGTVSASGAVSLS